MPLAHCHTASCLAVQSLLLMDSGRFHKRERVERKTTRRYHFRFCHLACTGHRWSRVVVEEQRYVMRHEQLRMTAEGKRKRRMPLVVVCDCAHIHSQVVFSAISMQTASNGIANQLTATEEGVAQTHTHTHWQMVCVLARLVNQFALIEFGVWRKLAKTACD